MTKFTFVSAERAHHPVATLCRVLGVSVSGFYAWLHAIPALQNRAEAEAELRGHGTVQRLGVTLPLPTADLG